MSGSAAALLTLTCCGVLCCAVLCCAVLCCAFTVPVQVKLPQRVPHGFHAMWVTGQQIKQQQLPGLALQATE
jgi:hypothetical protein